MLAATGIGLGLILTRLDPTTRALNPTLLEIDVFLLIYCLAFCIGFFIRRRFGLRELAREQLIVSVREAILLAIVAVVSLILLPLGFFTLLNALLLVLSVIFLESYFLFR
jgi:hypothetical protein